MAIRFQCARCQQPIEVDDALAGKLARCPYCQTVVNVPAQSALPDGAIASARPAMPGAPPPPPLPPLRSPASGLRWERFALVCASIVGALVIGIWWRGTNIMDDIAKARGFTATSRPTTAQLWEMMEPFQKAVDGDSVSQGLVLGAAFFGLVGTIAAVVAIRSGRRWPAWVSLAICAPVLMCQCCGLLTGLRGLVG